MFPYKPSILGENPLFLVQHPNVSSSTSTCESLMSPPCFHHCSRVCEQLLLSFNVRISVLLVLGHSSTHEREKRCQRNAIKFQNSMEKIWIWKTIFSVKLSGRFLGLHAIFDHMPFLWRRKGIFFLRSNLGDTASGKQPYVFNGKTHPEYLKPPNSLQHVENYIIWHEHEESETT